MDIFSGNARIKTLSIYNMPLNILKHSDYISLNEYLGIKVCHECLLDLLPIELRLGDGKTCMDCE